MHCHNNNNFECRIKRAVEISYSIQSRKEWDTIQRIKSFDMHFDEVYASLSKHNTLTSPSHNHHYYRITAVDNICNGCQGRGPGRGSRRGSRIGVRGGKGQVRRRQQYEPQTLERKYGSFVTEARIYPKQQWMALSCDRHKSVTFQKSASVWLDGGTPLSGFTLNEQLRAVISTSLFRNQEYQGNPETG